MTGEGVSWVRVGLGMTEMAAAAMAVKLAPALVDSYRWVGLPVPPNIAKRSLALVGWTVIPLMGLLAETAGRPAPAPAASVQLPPWFWVAQTSPWSSPT